MIIFKKKILLVLLIVSGALMLFSLGLIYFNIASFGSPVILHFDAFKGVDFLGDRLDVWLIWLSVLLIMILNVLLGEFLFYRERILAYLLIGANLLLALLTLAVSGVIVSVN
ncbi:MAG: hypothetical protein UY23_C0004G0027 [Candidatus Jorgensenbacteria bacterium GW2011_GWA1_48_11]|uniref:DUF1648 domain-containing protein n=1 Tax=Candidatus Jorgensenbacteria bacterium GW2011_GWA1_48_11 TaxID=1618660 RepID=A0A0G1UAC5_9BACT|nr:MAG: hypothetical protein UY23_C0004G0027 [Candidatus Jorgensenbacteria bacterium GW2011_GWA1_48_11]KKW11792.1 MAG: hypothetical protein UY51_C0005G0033 [Candidatus Jorgensenbacteria bacterium GW2011_GWB1_49_9]